MVPPSMHLMVSVACLVILVANAQNIVEPSNSGEEVGLSPPSPKITCGTCRTATSITLDWTHDSSSTTEATFYNVYWRIKKSLGESNDAWQSRKVDKWDDITVQVTVGCCTGCETDVQPECKQDNLLSSRVYEIVAESVNIDTVRNKTHTRVSVPLAIPTGQDGTQMPRQQQNPKMVDAPLETLCSLLGVCSQLSYNDKSQPIQSMTKQQQILTMDKSEDEEGKVGGYDNSAAIAFFEKYKKVADNTVDQTKYIVSTLGSGSPSPVSIIIGKVAHVTQQSMNQLPERPTVEWFNLRVANSPGLFFSSILGTHNRKSRVQWLATSSEGYGLTSQHFLATDGTTWTDSDAWAQNEAATSNDMGTSKVSHLVTAVATTGGSNSDSPSSEQWVVVASAGVCENVQCPQKIITGKVFPWDEWKQSYNAGFRVTSMAASDASGWVLVLHQNSGVGLQRIVQHTTHPNSTMFEQGWTLSSMAGNKEGWHVVHSQPNRFGPPCLKVCANEGVLDEDTCTCSCKFPWFGDSDRGMKKGVGCQSRPEPCVLSEFSEYDAKCPVACDGDYRRRRRTILKEPSVAPAEDGPSYNGASCAVVNCQMNRAAFVDRTNILKGMFRLALYFNYYNNN